MMTSKPYSSYKMQFAVRYPIPSCVQESKYHACPYLLIHSLNERAFVPLDIQGIVLPSKTELPKRSLSN